MNTETYIELDRIGTYKTQKTYTTREYTPTNLTTHKTYLQWEEDTKRTPENDPIAPNYVVYMLDPFQAI